MSGACKAILFVDDDSGLANAWRRTIEISWGAVWRAAAAYGSRDAVEHATRSRFDVALVDLVLGDEDGVEVAALLRSMCPGIVIGLCSAAMDVTGDEAATFDFLVGKPTTMDVIIRRATDAMSRERPTLADVTRAHVLAIFERNGRNVSATARELGISRQATQTRLRSLRQITQVGRRSARSQL